MCRLHNFLVNASEESNGAPLAPTAEDALNSRLSGGYDPNERRIPELGGSQVTLAVEAVGGGEHFDDDEGQVMRREIARQNPTDLPRERIYRMICESDMRRPSRRR